MPLPRASRLVMARILPLERSGAGGHAVALIIYAIPILHGKEQQAREFGARLDDAGFRARYEELNRAAGIARPLEPIQQLPSSPLRIVAFETATPERLARRFDDADPYDRWWREEVRAIHGFDPAEADAPGIEMTWDRPGM
jgi:hypothetical protein